MANAYILILYVFNNIKQQINLTQEKFPIKLKCAIGLWYEIKIILKVILYYCFQFMAMQGAGDYIKFIAMTDQVGKLFFIQNNEWELVSSNFTTVSRNVTDGFKMPFIRVRT